jgi:hypothetical protein
MLVYKDITSYEREETKRKGRADSRRQRKDNSSGCQEREVPVEWRKDWSANNLPKYTTQGCARGGGIRSRRCRPSLESSTPPKFSSALSIPSRKHPVRNHPPTSANKTSKHNDRPSCEAQERKEEKRRGDPIKCYGWAARVEGEKSEKETLDQDPS